MIRSDLHAEQSGDVLHEACEATEGELWVVNPTRAAMSQFVSAFWDDPSPSPSATPVRLFSAREPLVRLTDDFLLASVMADLVTTDVLDVRTLESVPRHSLLVTGESVVSVVECEHHVAGLTTTADDVLEATREEYAGRWETAEEFSLRTPPLSAVRETLEDEVGPAAVSDLDRVLTALDADHDSAAGLGLEELDEVCLLLLVAASNGELLYDISRWGEGVRLASKATFSRTKNRLEEAGLVDTEKVPIDVGRPRLRLVLGDDLTGRDIEAVARHARSVLE